MTTDLLPSNATPFERAFSLAIDAADRVASGVGAVRTAKLVTVPETFLPFLAYEYGLGEVSAFVPDQRLLIASGIAWQRVRGTPEAIAVGLDWLAYRADLEEAPARRRRWNLFQLALASLPAQEAPDLESIDRIASLSVPVRSRFWRGFAGYDVREAEWSRTAWGRAAWSSSSGVRLSEGGAKWSFGRPHNFPMPLGQDDLEPLGAWQPGAGGAPSAWDATPWNAAGLTWTPAEVTERNGAIIAALRDRVMHLEFRSASGAVIGYRRARVIRPARIDNLGQYDLSSYRLAADNVGPTGLYVEFLTGFGDGFGATAATAAVVFDGVPAVAGRPGALWLGPGQLTGGTRLRAVPLPITFRRAMRERVRFHFTF